MRLLISHLWTASVSFCRLTNSRFKLKRWNSTGSKGSPKSILGLLMRLPILEQVQTGRSFKLVHVHLEKVPKGARWCILSSHLIRIVFIGIILDVHNENMSTKIDKHFIQAQIDWRNVQNAWEYLPVLCQDQFIQKEHIKWEKKKQRRTCWVLDQIVQASWFQILLNPYL